MIDKILKRIQNVVDKIIAALVVLSAAIGALLLSRSARAADQSLDPAAPDFVPASASATGLRNKNPFNLEFRDIGWRGEIGTDGRFSIFNTNENGIRAGMINIHTKITRDGLQTVRKLITRLSPSFENPTEAFISFVSRQVGVAPDQTLDFRTHIISLSKAIIQFENGEQPFSNEELHTALEETGKV